MIDFKNQLIFIHIPKTAGTSVESALLDDPRIEDHNGTERSDLIKTEYKDNFCHCHHPHSALAHHREQLGERFSEYKTFTIVRNPYELAFSRFCYQYRYKQREYFTKERFTNFLHLYRFPFRYDTLISIDEEEDLDAIIDFSDLTETLQTCFDHWGVGPINLPFANRSKHEALNYRDFYTEQSKSIVSEVFCREIIRFGWTFDGSHNGLRLWKDLSREEQQQYQTVHRKSLQHQFKDLASRALSHSKTYMYGKAYSRTINRFANSKRRKQSDKVSVSLCTHPPRFPLLKFSVYSLVRQVDAVYVYLNNIEKVPWWLQHPKITVVTSSHAAGDLKTSGKYFFHKEIEGYHLVADDDLIYPANYVQRMIEGLEKYNRQCLLCCHGSILNYPLLSYYNGRIATHYRRALQSDVRLHIASFNSVAFHTNTIRYTLEDFPQKNMDDIYGSLKAHKQGVPIISLAKSAHWIVDGPAVNEEQTIYANRDSYEAGVVNVLKEHAALLLSSDE